MPFGRSGLKNFAATTCYTVYVINLAIDQDWSLLLKEKISSWSLASSYIPGQTKWAVLMIEMVKFVLVYFPVEVYNSLISCCVMSIKDFRIFFSIFFSGNLVLRQLSTIYIYTFLSVWISLYLLSNSKNDFLFYANNIKWIINNKTPTTFFSLKKDVLLVALNKIKYLGVCRAMRNKQVHLQRTSHLWQFVIVRIYRNVGSCNTRIVYQLCWLKLN